MKNLTDARILAHTMVEIGKAVGRKTVAVLTDMSQPLGTSIGNRLEILESLSILQGKGREDVTTFICVLAQILLGLANIHKDVKEIKEQLINGKALEKFEQMVVAQGGDLEDLYCSSSARYQTEVVMDKEGYISELPAMEFGLFAMRLGAGRSVKTDDLDFETGIVFEKKIGDRVRSGEIVARIYSNQKISQELVTEFKKNVKICNERIKINEIIEVIA